MLKDNFAGCKLWFGGGFFPHSISTSFHSLFAGMASVLSLVPLYTRCFSPLWLLSRLSLRFFAVLNMICLGIDFWHLSNLMFYELLESLIWCLSLILESSQVLFLQIFLLFHSFFVLHLGLQFCLCYTFYYCLAVAGYFLVGFFCCYVFILCIDSDWEVSSDLSSRLLIFLSCVQSTDDPIKSIVHVF